MNAFLFFFSNQSARELSQFAESAMAVNRVILQHFSMKYDYMTKERPNIYEPSSRAKFQLGESDDDIEVGVPACETSAFDTAIDAVAAVADADNISMASSLMASLSAAAASTQTKQNSYCGDNACVDANTSNCIASIEATTVNTNQGLDSITELKAKLPIVDKSLLSGYNNKTIMSGRDSTAAAATVPSPFGSSKLENGGFYKTNFSNLRPEDNWRYRSANIDDLMPNGFRNYRHFNTNNVAFNSNSNNRSITVVGPSSSVAGGGNNVPQWRKHINTGFSHSTNDAKAVTSSNGIQIRNWRNECMTNASSRNCAAAVAAEESAANAAGNHRRDSDTSDASTEYVNVGLSPPSESLLMQRRMRLMSRSSDIPLRGPPPATASG